MNLYRLIFIIAVLSNFEIAAQDISPQEFIIKYENVGPHKSYESIIAFSKDKIIQIEKKEEETRSVINKQTGEIKSLIYHSDGPVIS